MSSKINDIKRQINNLALNISSLRAESENINRKIVRKQRTKMRLEKQLSELSQGNEVDDSEVVEYLLGKFNLTLSDVKGEILSERKQRE